MRSNSDVWQSHSDTQWRSRFWQVLEDTAKINAAAEFGGEVGSFTAGVAANKIIEGYMEDMGETCLTLDEYEKLNLKIFKQQAKQLQEFVVPEYMQGDICERPNGNPWNENDIPDDGIDFGSGSNTPDPTPKFPSDSGTDGGSQISDSSVCQDQTISDTDFDNGGIFGKIFSFLGFFGGGEGDCSGASPAPTITAEQDEFIADLLFGFGGGGFYESDPSAAFNNPPAFSFFSTPPD